MSFRILKKLGRELLRGLKNLFRLGKGLLFEIPRQWFYDRLSARLERLAKGESPLTDSIAIFVLFQPDGLESSTLLTLDHLNKEGWSVIVVSNAPLQTHALSSLLKKATFVLQRPNVGYDFGAYRAGVFLVWRLELKPESLILMNDSTWFPLRNNDSTLKRMRALNVEVAGHIFKTESRPRSDHLESHLLMFNRSAINHPIFRKFWGAYLMSDDRVTTIRRGEKMLSQSFLRAGLSVEGLLSRERLLASLEALRDEFLLEVVKKVLHHRSDTAIFCRNLIQAAEKGETWREDFLKWVKEVLSNSKHHFICTTFVEPAMRLCGLSFIKKANDLRFHLARERVLQLEAEKKIPPIFFEVHQEIKKEVIEWAPKVNNNRLVK